MSAPLDPIPIYAELVPGGTLTPDWFRWLYQVWLRVKGATQMVKAIALTGQTATITTTTAYSVAQTGVYRVSYAIRVTTPAATTSAATVSISWRDSGVLQVQSGAAMTGNTTTTQQNDSFFVRADSGASITYSVSYASNPAAAMVYKVDVVTEFVN